MPMPKKNSLEKKARRARELATEAFGGVSYGKTEALVKQNAKRAGRNLSAKELEKATNIMQQRRQSDRNRVASRAEAQASPNSPANKRASRANMVAAVAGAAKKAVKKTAKKKMGK